MRRTIFGRFVTVGARQRSARWRSRLDRFQGLPRIDQGTATGHVIGIDQTCDRHFDKVCIANVQFAICVGDALGFEEQMPEGGAVVTKAGEIEAFKLAQHLRHRNPSG